ncbi:hypothetical protein VTK73DRAFT_6570 [Phialemonium thermophilum]|uniref:Uncharacterized protein n=1 Tax=Phialemonium thermophilum TaxID=223376 RepID=A0ABR3WJI6_9PEZI
MDQTLPEVGLPNKPQTKLPRLPKGSRVHKRPLPSRNHHGIASSVDVDLDGYHDSGMANKNRSVCVYVSTKTPFMAVVRRIRRALYDGPQGTKGMPLTTRVAALSTASGGIDKRDDETRGDVGSNTWHERAPVLVVGTGRAIEKTLNVAAWFDREKDCTVSLRTRTLGAVDDIVGMPDDFALSENDAEDTLPTVAETEGEARLRMISCLEVIIGLR